MLSKKQSTVNLLNKSELQAVILLAFVFALRVLGMFMILPVFVIFAGEEYVEASPKLVGIAVGIYGLAQGLLQIPFGILSDYFGRKKVICLGLSIFMLGSIVAMLANSIYGVIFGRIMQGCGAIGCVVLASVADATRENVRIKAMGIVGITIGSVFILAILLGPVLHSWIKLQGIFLVTVILAATALILTIGSPQISNIGVQQKPLENLGKQLQLQFKAVLMPKLTKLYLGVFLLHAALAGLFLVVPITLKDLGVFYNYFPIIVLGSVVIAMIVIKYVLKAAVATQVIIICIASILLSLVALIGGKHSVSTVFVSLLMFFSGFNILEATLPALVTKYAPTNKRGVAMGFFSSSQFLGVFAGGMVGGFFN